MRSAPAWFPAFLCLAALASASGANAGPVAIWHFDEAGGAIAHDSLGDADGTLEGIASFAPGGISGNAVLLAGGGVNMGDRFPFDSGDFSIVAWVKTTLPGYSLIAGKQRANTDNGYTLFLGTVSCEGSSGKAGFYVSKFCNNEAISTTTVNDGAWHQLVGVYRAGVNKRIYVDGVLEGLGSGDPMVANIAPFLVGGGGSSGDPSVPLYTFNGLVDELQLYDSALSESDVAFLFMNPSRAPEPESWVAELAAFGCVSWIARRALVSRSRAAG